MHSVIPKNQFLLSEDDVPTHWYNILPDLPFDVPTERKARNYDNGSARIKQRISPQLPLSMYKQGISTDRYIEIPDEVRDEYRRWRPTPLYRALRLERFLDTPAKIYYKYEGSSPAGSHKLNTAIAQAYYYKKAGIEHLTTGTGAGQWGTALAMACHSFGIRCTVYMVKCSYNQKPYRKTLMLIHGADVVPSPSQETEVGRQELTLNCDSNGSLSVANAEAIEHAIKSDKCCFSVGSGENHVLLHQTVIGLESIKQMEQAGEFPDIIIGCMGAGSNFAGFAFPFFSLKTQESHDIKFIAVEPDACPKMTRGVYTWDYNDFSCVTPLTKMYTLGHRFMAPAIHSGGLRYHGAAPLISAIYHNGLIEAVSYPQSEVFDAAIKFSQAEKFLPAPESAHAVKCAIDEALKAKEEGEQKVILFNMSGHGLLDLSAYEQYLNGEMVDYKISDDEILSTLACLPTIEE